MEITIFPPFEACFFDKQTSFLWKFICRLPSALSLPCFWLMIVRTIIKKGEKKLPTFALSTWKGHIDKIRCGGSGNSVFYYFPHFSLKSSYYRILFFIFFFFVLQLNTNITWHSSNKGNETIHVLLALRLGLSVCDGELCCSFLSQLAILTNMFSPFFFHVNIDYIYVHDWFL